MDNLLCRTFVGVLQQGKYAPALFYDLWVLHEDFEWLLNYWSDEFAGCDSTLLHCAGFIAVWDSAEHLGLSLPRRQNSHSPCKSSCFPF